MHRAAQRIERGDGAVLDEERIGHGSARGKRARNDRDVVGGGRGHGRLRKEIFACDKKRPQDAFLRTGMGRARHRQQREKRGGKTDDHTTLVHVFSFA